MRSREQQGKNSSRQSRSRERKQLAGLQGLYSPCYASDSSPPTDACLNSQLRRQKGHFCSAWLCSHLWQELGGWASGRRGWVVGGWSVRMGCAPRPATETKTIWLLACRTSLHAALLGPGCRPLSQPACQPTSPLLLLPPSLQAPL